MGTAVALFCGVELHLVLSMEQACGRGVWVKEGIFRIIFVRVRFANDQIGGGRWQVSILISFWMNKERMYSGAERFCWGFFDPA